jgi:hypothetical protein
VAEHPSARPALIMKRAATVTAFVTVGFSFDDEPTVDSQDELAVATSGSHNLRRRSYCNLCAHSRLPTLRNAITMQAWGQVSCRPFRPGFNPGIPGHAQGVPLRFLVRRQCTRRGRQAVPLPRKVLRTSRAKSTGGMPLTSSDNQII